VTPDDSAAAPPPPTVSGPPPLPAAAAARHAEKQEALARVYDAEVWPSFASHFATLARRALRPRPGARVVELGCATGALTAELARAFDGASRVTALDDSTAFVERARARLADEPGADVGRVAVEVGGFAPIPLADGVADVVLARLENAVAAEPARLAREVARVLARGGEAILTTPLRGSWVEFLDIFRDVLLENGTPASLAALDQYTTSLPTPAEAAGWLEAAGLSGVTVAVDRWEILFKSSREFFFAPLVELGPLSKWKRIAGKGDAMQDTFFFTKEAIDTYFRGSAFAVTIAGAVVTGRKAR
jgi:SAM-dependent methyltransferase